MKVVARCLIVLCVWLQSTRTFAVDPPITALTFVPRQAVVLTVSQLGLSAYSWPTLRRLATRPLKSANPHELSFSPDGKWLLVAGGHPAEDGLVELFAWPEEMSPEAIPAELQAAAVFSGHTDSVRTIAWRDSATFYSGGMDRTIHLWDRQQPDKPTRTFRGHSRSISALCFLKSHDVLVSTGTDQSVRVWDAQAGALLRNLNQHTRPVHALAIRPGASRLPMVASAADDRTVRLWQPTIGRMVRYVRLESRPLDIAWTDEAHLVAACEDGHVRLIDADNVQVVATKPAIDGWAYAVSVHPESGDIVVGGSGGQPVRLPAGLR